MRTSVAITVLGSSAVAFADEAPAPAPVATPGTVEPASPWGSSPHVVAYRPPAVEDRTHRGLTLELAMGGGNNPSQGGTGAGTFAIGWWVHPKLALAFRATAVGNDSFVGGSLQYYALPKVWLGAGGGQMTEDVRVDFESMSRSGPAAFARAGYNLASKGGHTLYVSGEVQVAQFDSSSPAALALFAIGYQLR